MAARCRTRQQPINLDNSTFFVDFSNRVLQQVSDGPFSVPIAVGVADLAL